MIHHITADKKRERKGKEKKREEEREKVNYAGGVIEMKTGGGKHLNEWDWHFYIFF